MKCRVIFAVFGGRNKPSLVANHPLGYCTHMNMIIKIARSRIVVGAAALSLFVIAGCGGDVEYTERQTPGSSAADAASEAPAAKSSIDDHPHATGAVTLAGIIFTPPTAWSNLGNSGMRQAQYRTDPVQGDTAQGEVNVFYFGPTSGGGVEANLDRWVGQMVMPDGSDSAASAKRSTFVANGMKGHIVSLNGNYKSGGGRPMGGDTTIMEGYRLVGVVLEGPQGSLFFKLTGPLATAEAMESDLLEMVKAAHP